MAIKFGFGITGITDLKKTLADYDKQTQTDVRFEVAEGLLNIHAEARKSIQSHRSKGATYGNHTASKPGFPPNTDTGRLVNSIEFDFDKEKAEGVVGTNLDYGKHLEYGTSNIDARPWLAPAYLKFRDRIIKNIQKVLKFKK